MDWKFGQAKAQDFNRINALFIEMLQTIYDTDDVNGYREGDLDRFFDGRDEWICTAVKEEEIVAFLSIEVHHEKEEFLYLDDLSVTAGCRNQGIGTALVKRAEAYAGEIGIQRIFFHVEGSNRAAFRLYTRLGYTIHEEQGSRYLMTKQMTQ